MVRFRQLTFLEKFWNTLPKLTVSFQVDHYFSYYWYWTGNSLQLRLNSPMASPHLTWKKSILVNHICKTHCKNRFFMIPPTTPAAKSLHCKLVPAHYQEQEYGFTLQDDVDERLKGNSFNFKEYVGHVLLCNIILSEQFVNRFLILFFSLQCPLFEESPSLGYFEKALLIKLL